MSHLTKSVSVLETTPPRELRVGTKNVRQGRKSERGLVSGRGSKVEIPTVPTAGLVKGE